MARVRVGLPPSQDDPNLVRTAIVRERDLAPLVGLAVEHDRAHAALDAVEPVYQ
ncbi:MAG: hypothetical protein IRY99_27305 [Isosphaeraceae bacterium]|nr:hypothetical protein [Isosphaeraceae bacterium]